MMNVCLSNLRNLQIMSVTNIFDLLMLSQRQLMLEIYLVNIIEFIRNKQ